MENTNLSISKVEKILSKLEEGLYNKWATKDKDFFSVASLVTDLRKLRDDLIKAEREKTANLSPEIRYEKDPYFRQLVDMLETFIHAAHFSPSELREAASLAAIRYEIRNPKVLVVRAKEELEKLNIPYE